MSELIKQIAERLWDSDEHQDTDLPEGASAATLPYIGATARELARIENGYRDQGERLIAQLEIVAGSAEDERDALKAKVRELEERIASLERAEEAATPQSGALTGEQLERIITAALAAK